MTQKQFVWTFPGGRKVIEKGAAVAGNVAVTKACPAGKVRLLINVNITLTTDATVVNRYPYVEVRDSVPAIKFSNLASAIPASQTKTRLFCFGISSTADYINGLGYNILVATDDVYLYISGGVAGDAYDYIIEYLEIDEP